MQKSSSSGRKIGRKMTMISVHSSGQPSTKMIACVMSRNMIGDRLRPMMKSSTTFCPPM